MTLAAPLCLSPLTTSAREEGVYMCNGEWWEEKIGMKSYEEEREIKERKGERLRNSI